MRSLQEEMLEALRRGEMTIEELISEMLSLPTEASEFDVKSALLPLMSTGQVVLDSSRTRIKLAASKPAAVGSAR